MESAVDVAWKEEAACRKVLDALWADSVDPRDLSKSLGLPIIACPCAIKKDGENPLQCFPYPLWHPFEVVALLYLYPIFIF